jgi:hypothetical protein
MVCGHKRADQVLQISAIPHQVLPQQPPQHSELTFFNWTISNANCSTSASVTVNYFASPTQATITTSPLSYCGVLRQRPTWRKYSRDRYRSMEQDKRTWYRHIQRRWHIGFINCNRMLARYICVYMDNQQRNLYANYSQRYSKLLYATNIGE